MKNDFSYDINTRISEDIEKSYKYGFSDGIEDTLLKIAKYNKESGEEYCFMFAMNWKDLGCPCDCVRCILDHLHPDRSE